MGWQDISTAPKRPYFQYDGHRYGPHILGGISGKFFTRKWWETDKGDGGSNFIDDGGNAVFPTHWMCVKPPGTP